MKPTRLSANCKYQPRCEVELYFLNIFLGIFFVFKYNKVNIVVILVIGFPALISTNRTNTALDKGGVRINYLTRAFESRNYLVAGKLYTVRAVAGGQWKCEC